MKTLAALLFLAASANVSAQMRPSEVMPLDAQHALRVQLANRLSARIAVTSTDDAVVKNVKVVRDREVLDKIEDEFDHLLQRRPLKPGIALPDFQKQRFEQLALARAELYDLAVSNIPDDKILQVSGLTKLELLSEAKKSAPNINLTERLSSIFPKNDRGTLRMLNPMTPHDGGPVPVNATGGSAFNPTTGRSLQTYQRRAFGVVGVLADVSVIPFMHICSGTLVSNNWFLTATHCLFDRDTKARISVDHLGVFFPFQGGLATVRRWSDGKENRNLAGRPITKVIEWFGEVGGQNFPITEREVDLQIKAGNDAVLIELTPLEGAVQNPSIVRVPAKSDVYPPLTLAGYGLTNAKNTVGDLLLEVGLRMDLISSDDKGWLLKTGADSSLGTNVRICAGDSGGPVFRGAITSQSPTVFELIAISSAIVAPDSTVESCSQGVQRFTRIDRTEVRAWLCAKAGAGC